MVDILKATDKEVLEIAHQLCEGYKMKRVLRYNTKRDTTVHSESDAEHVFALIYLAHYFTEAEPNAKLLDKEKLFSIFTFHDFGEIKHGDIIAYEKTDAHRERESEAAKEVFASLPEPINKIGYEFWRQYEEKSSPEGSFAYALDKVEPLFELLNPVNEQSLKGLKTTYDMNITHKLNVTEPYPVMRRFVEVISNDMKARGVFWEE